MSCAFPRIVLVFIFLSYFPQVHAQHKIDSIATYLASQIPEENIHLHLDKEIYLPGETVWFKAYIFSGGKPGTISNILFTELWDEHGKRLSNFTSPIFEGISSGQFELADSLINQVVTIRSFTRQMITVNNIYSKRISIVGETNPHPVKKDADISLQLFAEGGNFINNVANIISFKATASNGKPYLIKGVIKDQDNHFIDSVKAAHDGMGKFIFYPRENETYFIEWEDSMKRIQTTPFPISVSRGIALQVSQQKNELTYFIQNPIPGEDLKELFVVASSGNQVMYAARVKPGERSPFGKFSTADLPSGIIQITVFNKDMQPLAERIVFVNNHEFSFQTKIEVIEKNLAGRGKNIIEIKSTDLLRQNLSVAITDASFAPGRKHNIMTDLLLTGDIRGYVFQPEQYFYDTSALMKGYLDLVMQTNGWRRYNWKKIAAGIGDVYPVNEDYISFSGKVTDLEGKPVPAALVSMILRTKDSASEVMLLPADEKGIIRQNNLIFFDSATLFYSVTKTKTARQKIEISPGKQLSYHAVDFNPLVLNTVQDFSETASKLPFREHIKSKISTVDTFEKKAKLLEEVTVKSKAKDSLELMDEKYSKYHRGTKGGKMWDFKNDPNLHNTDDFMKYLLTWKLPTHPSLGFAFYLNDVAVSDVRLAAIKIQQVAFVKYVPDDFSRPFSSGVYIYLKNDEDYQEEYEKKFKTRPNQVKINGFTPVKEFYRPDYSIPENASSKVGDFQATLFWQPNLVIDNRKGVLHISFSNNDISKKLKVVLEGINEAGQLTYAEKIIE